MGTSLGTIAATGNFITESSGDVQDSNGGSSGTTYFRRKGDPDFDFDSGWNSGAYFNGATIVAIVALVALVCTAVWLFALTSALSTGGDLYDDIGHSKALWVAGIVILGVLAAVPYLKWVRPGLQRAEPQDDSTDNLFGPATGPIGTY